MQIYERFKEKNSIEEVFFLFLLYFISVFIEYFTFKLLSQFYLIILLVLFWNSKKDYFWFALFFFLIESPGYVLTSFDALHHLPSYDFLLGYNRQIDFFELFIILALLKAFIKRNKKIKIVFIKPLTILIFYTIFLFMLSFFFGIDNMRIFRTLRCLLPFTLFYSGLKLLSPREGYIKFFYLIFPIVFYVIAVQFIEIIISNRLAFYLGGISAIENDVLYESLTGTARLLYSYYLIVIAFIGSLFFLSFKKKYFSRIYLYSVLLGCILSILFSATRGFFISLVAMLVLYFFFVSKKTIQTILKMSIPTLVIISVINFIPILKNQFENAFKRIETVQLLIKGDVTAGGTLGRLTVRGPRVLNKIKESPIVGFGFSNSFWNYHDNHVGHYTMILNGGFIGLFLFMLFMLYFLFKAYLINRNLQNKNIFKNTPLVIIVAAIGLLIWHSTSNMIFSFIISWSYNGWGFALTFFFSFSNYIFIAASKEEISIRTIAS